MNITYFISDLHLDNINSDSFKLFEKFIKQKIIVNIDNKIKVDALYILGDFFEVYTGINNLDILLKNKLREIFSMIDIPVYLMPGNRDFLLTQKDLDFLNIKLLTDPCTINLYTKKILLTHGDLLCSLNKEYLFYRKFVQNYFIKYIFLLLPTKLRKIIGNKIRNKSRNKNNYDNIIHDVVDTTVIDYLKKYNSNFIIHGHTHKANIHNIENIDNNKNYTRIVLGDWHDTAYILEYNSEHKYNLYNFNL